MRPFVRFRHALPVAAALVIIHFLIACGGGVRKPDQAADDKEPPTDLAAQDARKGDVSVKLIEARVMDENFIRLAIDITNHNATRRLSYKGWGYVSPIGDRGRNLASLRDEHGSLYQPIRFRGEDIVGQVEQAFLDPGQARRDYLVFDKPAAVSNQFTLTLPLAAIEGQSGEIRGTFPRELISR